MNTTTKTTDITTDIHTIEALEGDGETFGIEAVLEGLYKASRAFESVPEGDDENRAIIGLVTAENALFAYIRFRIAQAVAEVTQAEPVKA